MRKKIAPADGPAPKGVYSPAILADGKYLFVSGQAPIDPESNELTLGSFEQQARLVFDNVKRVLTAAGTSWQNVVRTGVYLADLANFQQMNEIYREYLTEPLPARTTIQVGLPPKMLIEVDCVALIPE